MPPFTPKQLVLLWHETFLFRYLDTGNTQGGNPIIARLTNFCRKYPEIEANSVTLKKVTLHLTL